MSQDKKNPPHTTTYDPAAKAASGAITLSPQAKKQANLSAIIASRKSAFAMVATSALHADRIVKLAQAAITRTPKLAECTPGSVVVALMRCAELGLEPDSALPARRMWLVPRYNRKINGQECTYQIDYRAMIQIARDTGLVSSVVAEVVHKNDKFELSYSSDGTGIAHFKFEPNTFGDRGDVVGYFAAARLTTGEVQVATLTKAKALEVMERHGPKDQSQKTVGPWTTDFDAMACKTALRRLWNLLPAGTTPQARLAQEKFVEEIRIDQGAPVEAPDDAITDEPLNGHPPAVVAAEKLDIDPGDIRGSPPGAEAKAKAEELAAVVEKMAAEVKVEAQVKKAEPKPPTKTVEERLKGLFPESDVSTKPQKKGD